MLNHRSVIEERLEEDWLTLRCGNFIELRELELILDSRHVPYHSISKADECLIMIPRNSADRGRKEIQAYLKENENWPPVELKRDYGFFKPSVLHLLVIGILVLFHSSLSNKSFLRHWIERGRFDADQILGLEWPRVVTALTLHLDDPHLLSNAFALMIFLSGVNYFAGPGISALLVLLSGGLGNYLNALFYQTDHLAVGASTAVFGAVGLMGVLSAKNRVSLQSLRNHFLVPVIAALGIFALLGTNPSTDVFAHLFGLISGIAVGLIFGRLTQTKSARRPDVQSLAMIAFCVVIWASWKVQLG